MITADMYRSHLNSYGSNLAQVKQNQSNMVVNSAFTADAQYKRVYILTKDGWKFEDAKFQKHAKYSILKDAVDYDPSFVRYNVLQCNWKFKWIYNNKLYTCWGANRSANSYTSGKWTDFVWIFCTCMVRCKGKP